MNSNVFHVDFPQHTRAPQPRALDHAYRHSEGLDFGDTLDNVVATNLGGTRWMWRVVWWPLAVALIGFLVCLLAIAMRG